MLATHHFQAGGPRAFQSARRRISSPVQPRYRRIPRRTFPMPRPRVALAAVVVACAAVIGLSANAYGGGRGTVEQIHVHRGDTLWSIASTLYPDDDIRDRMSSIEDINHLDGSVIYPGEVLTVPAP